MKEEVNKVISESISEYIRVLRARKGITQEELAEQLCVSRISVSNWEQKISIPTLPVIISLAELGGTSIDSVVGRC